MSDNNINVTGNLTRAPELRFTTGGKAVCSFGIAVNRRYQQNGEWVDADPTFFNVSIWGQPGENTAASLSKGDRVVVVGRLEIRTWDKDDGTKGTSVDIVADEVALSFRFATATVQRTARTNNAAPDAAAAAPAGRPADPIYGDEAPF